MAALDAAAEPLLAAAEGPAGTAVTIADPGGAHLALFRPRGQVPGHGRSGTFLGEDVENGGGSFDLAPTKGAIMRYMIMMFGGLGASLAERSPEWISEMQATMMRMDRELREKGEVVESRHLTDPSRATTVRFVDGAPAPTDGPFAEIKESLAGYWVVEATHERALEIAAEVVAVTRYPMEVRRVMDEG
ncbi:YciI family protein [Dactylosporangium sp. AC04546]|uniref:YciI family protein n=1 Tax=Dactylosporangium sp. AC04546 TaxID=2862460 RepID=UPI001EE07004|nr:YciI family protein [Dactylosporangium sp. AC04546]WVK78723.1 YciI family protein [Dactylosporangium sp. AC04546]